jgi:hypothetical protein
MCSLYVYKCMCTMWVWRYDQITSILLLAGPLYSPSWMLSLWWVITSIFWQSYMYIIVKVYVFKKCLATQWVGSRKRIGSVKRVAIFCSLTVSYARFLLLICPNSLWKSRRDVTVYGWTIPQCPSLFLLWAVFCRCSLALTQWTIPRSRLREHWVSSC